MSFLPLPDRPAPIAAILALAATSCFQDQGGTLTAGDPTTTGNASTTATATTTAATTPDPSSTSGSTASPTSGSSGTTTTIDPGTTTTTTTTGPPPPDLPPCAFNDDFADPEISSSKWLLDNLTDPFTQGNAYFDVGEGYSGLRQRVELADIVDCVTSVRFGFELLSESSAIVVSIQLAGAPADPGDDENAVVITYTPDDGNIRADLRVGGVVTAFSPFAHVGLPTGFRIVRWGDLIVPGVRIDGDWMDFEPRPMPDYPDGQHFRMVKLAVYSNTRISFDDVNLP